MATAPECLGRKRPVPSCPNPLFVKWLTELRDTAREKGLKTQFVYQKALQSLQKYPLPLKTGREAKILQNFGDGICRMLDERLQEHLRGEEQQRRRGEEPGEALQSGTSSSSSLCSDGPSQQNSGHAPQPGRGGRRREYVPQKRSGGYAVLLTLHAHTQRPGSKGFMFRNELQTEAQALCDKSFTVPDLGSRYTAWSSVSTLVQKELLLKTHNPARYSLTERGRVLAQKLLSEESSQAEERSDRVVDLTLHEEEEEEEEDRGGGLITSDTQPGPASRWSLPHGSYTILLCVDVIETTGGSSARKQELVKELQRNGVTFDIRKLNVGDFLWIARENVAPVPGQLRPPPPKELVLDHIVERKRMDDLCGSIIDGRFREQKFRLKRCGLRRPVYLVEECGSAASHLSLPEATLQQAIVNTQVVDGFFVKRVQDMRESAAYLTIMTRQLQKLYQGCTLFCRSRELEGDEEEERKDHTHVSCSLITFSEFNHGAIKNKCQTVREVFARQLMQISGLSGDKAAAVLQHYSTVSSLLAAYDHCGSNTEREKLLATIRYGKLQRNLGPSLSRSVYQLYCSPAALT